MLPILILLLAIPAIITIIDFFAFLFSGNRVVGSVLLGLTEIASLIILPLLYGNFGYNNECCGDSLDTAVFSPSHQLTIEVIILLCLIAYFYSSYRKSIASPIVEVVINALLVIGIVFNIFIAIHTKEAWLAICGNVPIIILAVLVLVKNHRIFLEQSQISESKSKGKFENIAWQILHLRPLLKFPLILIICLPILIVLTSILILFGQKPDSIIKAFTDTYKHGFSQWDYKCDNVRCGGHYLCSVAAKGHKKIVKPKRFGVRNGGKIICNRQLLISNAFEDLIQEKTPWLHNSIRTQYNKVGKFIHRYYAIFDIKLLSDFVYILMKPLEMIFLLTLYTFDKNPENRIAKQYLSYADREMIDQHE